MSNAVKRRRNPRRRLEALTFNLLGSKARREMLLGREHLVIPCVMITEGVHNGSKGPGLYRESDTAPTIDDWNGMPVHYGHPKKKTARSPEVANKSEIGTVYNADWSKKKMTSEVWLDVERADEVDPAIIRNVKRGKKVEVSTGLYLYRQKKKGVFNGEKYIWIARDQKPDHLAILTDEIGACSIKKGCGLLANSRKGCGCPKCQRKSNKKKGVLTMLSRKRKTRMIRQLIKNSDVWSIKDKKTLLNMPDVAFKKVYKTAIEPDEPDGTVLNRDKVRKKKARVKNADRDAEPRRKGKKKIRDRHTPDWRKLMPPEVLAVVNEGSKMLKRRKDALIEVILNNEDNVFSKNWLGKQDPDVLEGIAALAAGGENAEGEEEGIFIRGYEPDYSGAAGIANSRRRRKRRDDDDEEEVEEKGLTAPDLFPTENSGDDDDDDDDDDDEAPRKKGKRKSKIRV